MMPEATYQKLRGGYYTPEPIANFLARWAIQTPRDEVLEPSCGDGSILVAGAKELLSLGALPNAVAEQLHGVELDPDEARKAISRLFAAGIPTSDNNIVHVGDFFSHCRQSLFGHEVLTLVTQQRRRFDVVIGNPPFIRYQSFPEEYRQLAFEMVRTAGLNPSRLTNTWLPFLVISSLLLKESGRLAMVIPAELFQVNYAAEVRQFLSEYFKRVTFVTFKQLLFADIQQEVVLLLAERNNLTKTGVRSIEVTNADDLLYLGPNQLDAIQLKPMDHSREKWTQYFLDVSEIKLLRELRDHPKITRANRVFNVDVGVVTGQNAFFVLTKSEAQARGLEPFLERLVSRSSHLKGAIFGAQDWQDNTDGNLPSLLFTPPDLPVDKLEKSLQEYIAFGEQLKIDSLPFRC